MAALVINSLAPGAGNGSGYRSGREALLEMSMSNQGTPLAPLYLESSRLRDLYTRVAMQAEEGNHKILGVTSAMDGEGKTTVAIGLAAMLAYDGVPADSKPGSGFILIVDCNPGERGVVQELMAEPIPGLTQFVQGGYSLADVVRPTSLPRLWVMPAGASGHTLSSLIRASDMREAMLHGLSGFRRVILDLPSVLTTADTQVLATFADQLLLVVRAGVTPSKLVTKALQDLDRRKLVGLVLNDQRPELPKWLEQRL